MRRSAVLPLAVITMLSRLGCTAVVQSPRELRDPVPTFLLDHGRTSSLVIPDEAGGLIRYGYGDWSYYALRHMGFFNAVAALFWPTPAALGRYPFSGPVRQDSTPRTTEEGAGAAAALLARIRDRLGLDPGGPAGERADLR